MELRSCYFCGAAGRTVTVRPVDGAAVALCPRCEQKLDRLRAAADDGATPVTFGPRSDAEGEASPDPPDEASPDPPDEASPDPPDETSPDPTDEASPDPTDETSPDPTDEASPDPTDEASPDDRPAPSDDASDRSPAGVPGLDATDRGDTSTYRKALRLLQNREFPIERAATVDLLSGAYDLDRAECERLLDLTVERGLLVEADGELRRS